VAPERPGGPRPCGIVSFTSDFGLADPFVGLVKAQVLARHPAAQIVDLTHCVTPFAIEEAAFWVERSYASFPEGTVHLVIVDPGVGTRRRIISVALDRQVFLGPDNGVLGPVAGHCGGQVRIVGEDLIGALGGPPPSATFHGRDIFGPLAGELAAGTVGFDVLGELTDDWVRLQDRPAQRLADRVLGRVLLVDDFGNCFSNIDSKLISPSQDYEVTFGEHLLPLVRTYGDRPAGTPVALVNAFGVLEAACVEGRACDALGLSRGSPVELRRRAPSPAGDGQGTALPES
jgi:hypothetical protein